MILQVESIQGSSNVQRVLNETDSQVMIETVKGDVEGESFASVLRDIASVNDSVLLVLEMRSDEAGLTMSLKENGEQNLPAAYAAIVGRQMVETNGSVIRIIAVKEAEVELDTSGYNTDVGFLMGRARVDNFLDNADLERGIVENIRALRELFRLIKM